MTIPTITDARALGLESGASKVAILTLDAGLKYSVTTWGNTTANCHAMARWAESEQATQTLEAMANTMPTAGVIDVALDPNTAAAHDARRDLLTEIRHIITTCRPGDQATALNQIRNAMDTAQRNHIAGTGKKA